MNDKPEITLDKQPETVTLRFKNRAERDRFLGGLSDGFGENFCHLEWPREQGIGFYECDTFDVTLYEDEYEEE